MSIPIPASLVRHLKERRCVLFAGAGLSAAAGLPDWKSLLRSMVAELESEGVTDGSTAELRALIDADKLLDVADHCRQRLGERRYQEFLGEQLRGGAGDIPEVHRLVTQLPFSAVVTTNYDKLLERAYANFRGELPKVVTSRDRETLGALLFSGGFFILKAHGDVDDAASLVLTARDYREIIHANAAFDALFSALLMTRSLLIIGYSLSDPDFRLLLDRQLSTFGENIPERYAVMSGVGAVEADVIRRSANIRVLPYRSGQHEDVSAFLRTLMERVTAAPAGGAPPPETAVAPGAPPRGSESPPRAAAAAPGESADGEAPAHLPIALRGVELHLAFRQDRLACRLVVGERPAPEHLSEPLSWALFSRRMATLLDYRTPERRRANYDRLGRRLGDLLPSDLLASIPDDHIVTLMLDRDLADVPWELAIGGGEGASALALERATVRRIVTGDSAQSRGTPGLRLPARVLVIGDPAAGGAPFSPLEGAFREAGEIAELYRSRGMGECTLLTRATATLDAVVNALSTHSFDVIHFAGHAWFDQHESFLCFGDESLTASELRPLLGRRPPALLVLNSHYTAFLPRGMRPGEVAQRPGDEESPPTRHIGFTSTATAAGIGAFIGGFDSPSDAAARTFGVGVHRELLNGRPIVEAVRAARQATLAAAPDDISALQYVLCGHPGYCFRGSD